MAIITQNPCLQEKNSNFNNSKLTELINNWAGINYIANSIINLNQSSNNSNSLFITSKLISKSTDTKNQKILKLLSVTLGITHIVLIITLISDLILLDSKTLTPVEDDELVNLWTQEMSQCIDLSETFMQILIMNYIADNDVISKEDLLQFIYSKRDSIPNNNVQFMSERLSVVS